MAPLLIDGVLIGPVTLVRNGDKTIGVTDAELLRPHVGAALTVATMLDGSATAAVGHWGLSLLLVLALHAAVGLLLGHTIAESSGHKFFHADTLTEKLTGQSYCHRFIEWLQSNRVIRIVVQRAVELWTVGR